MNLPEPYLLFLGDVHGESYAKTAFGLRDWMPNAAIGQLRLPGCTVTTGLPDLTPAQAAQQGVRAMLLGVAPVGGAIPPHWIPVMIAALEAGLDLVSGMHTRLASIPDVRAAAERTGRRLFDVRHTDRPFQPGTGVKRAGKRLLTVGTDCALGKKYTALAIALELQRRGRKATFRATGQTGVMIAGSGLAIDAVVADFISGAAEWLSPENDADHWDIIEGQGSLFHPAYAAVTLGLLHGSQPDAIVLCHEPTRRTVMGWPNYTLPDLHDAIDLYLRNGRLTNQAIRCVGISLNTSKLDDDGRARMVREVRARLDLPVFDPMRDGAGEVVGVLETLF
ncbi:MAG: DUF1611 domain-containing protein [Steroidobacteraceae bacterium]